MYLDFFGGNNQNLAQLTIDSGNYSGIQLLSSSVIRLCCQKMSGGLPQATQE